jgi:S1-C subfamily serine protease
MHGQVIGVTSQIETGNTGDSGNVGIGFAIPSNTVRTIVAQLITTGKALHAYLGVDTYGITKRLAHTFNLPVNHGVLVQTVTPKSAAANAGIVAGHTSVVMQGITYELGGDIITSVDGQPISTPEDLLNAIANLQPGDKLSLEIYRSGKEKHVTATLGNRPQAGP